MGKPILCLDFDGVIHSYTSGWQGAGICNDPPVAGTLEFLIEATKKFKVAIFSSRSKSLAGRRAMKNYMRTHFEMPLTFSPDHDCDYLHEALSYPWFKPPALITIDDRALTFTGNWADFGMARLSAFQPWNKPAKAMSAFGQDPQGLEAKPASAVAESDLPETQTRPRTFSKPNGHPADGMTTHVDCGDGAVMTIIDPRSFDDGGLEWVMRYGNPESIRYTVAMVLGSYDYLCSDNINMTEATKRLRLLRQARRECCDHIKETQDGT